MYLTTKRLASDLILKFRPYRPDDDPALMMLEQQCPRGEPELFVHYRRRFVDRAALFSSYYLLVVECEEELGGAIAAGIKDTRIQDQFLRIGYIFDLRVAPLLRRRSVAKLLVEILETELRRMGCDGVYANIVATNHPSIRLFSNLGYQRQRQLRYLTYQPMPLLFGEPVPTVRLPNPPEEEVLQTYQEHDLFVNDVISNLLPYSLEHWRSQTGNAAISVYDQSQLYQQIPADSPWPDEEEIERRGRHWRLFHPLGEAEALEALFHTIRDRAVTENIDKLTMVVDAEQAVAPVFFGETSAQREYVVLTQSFSPEWDGSFGPLYYCDSREL